MRFASVPAAAYLSMAIVLSGCGGGSKEQAGAQQTALTPWESESPVLPLPQPPLGSQADFASLSFTVTPEKVRLGRWLFFDGRLSSDGSVACATCHRPENAFSEPTPHSTGVGGQTGNRKSPTFINGAWSFYPDRKSVV